MDTAASPTLDRIRAAGVLRVGTTGDYTDGGAWTRLENAYMFSQNPAMNAYIDAWLAAAFTSGAWHRALGRAMSSHEE